MKKKSLFLTHLGLFFWSIALCMTLGCAAAVQAPSAPPAPARVVLAPGDKIDIKFAYSQQFNEEQIIRHDGKIEMQFVGEVVAAGKTPGELRDELMQLYAQHLKYPELAVYVRESMDSRVYVGGEVTKPGLVDMPGRLTALEAIMEAGGFKNESAGPGGVVVIRERDNTYEGIALDLTQPLGGKSVAAFYLQPHDIVVVPQSTIVKMDQWVDQYINKMIPYTGLNIQKTSGSTTWGYSTAR